ncbi:hypothetical protein AB0O20_20685 [Streptomyces kronopolitis]|uniref:hypothetical protein n=1 Tax=Streptomyces kronopolitis TaxID=1612435 RepID=UPI00342B6A18
MGIRPAAEAVLPLPTAACRDGTGAPPVPRAVPWCPVSLLSVLIRKVSAVPCAVALWCDPAFGRFGMP